MNKKTIKGALDIIKGVEMYRPSLYNITIKNGYAYFTDGYIIVRIKADHKDAIVGGKQLKVQYATLKAKEYCTEWHDDGGTVPDYEEMYERFGESEPIQDGATIDPNVFKKLAPFGNLKMTIVRSNKYLEQKLVKFEGDDILAYVCPMVEK